jgi:hypothetical protein
MLPLPRTRKRLAAPLLVFIFGIAATPFFDAARRLPTEALVWPDGTYARGFGKGPREPEN